MSTELSEVARNAALHQLAAAHNHWSEEEQRLAGQGKAIEAQGAHEMAVTCLRAYRVELDDPKPPTVAEPIHSYWEWLRRYMGQ